MRGRDSLFRAGAARGAALALAANLAACATAPAPGGGGPVSPQGLNGTMAPYQVNGVWYRPHAQPGYDEVGVATWYGAQYHYRRTADGETFDADRPSAAHTTLPLPCLVEVTNLDNGRRIRVRVNDRGPFVRGRILDLSRQAAKDLGFYGRGSARVRVRYVGAAPLAGGGRIETAAFAAPPPVPAARTPPPASLPAAQPPDGAALMSPSPPRVQAGAFAERENAERAAAQFQGETLASIEPLDRGGARLWRVVVTGARGEDARSLRARVIRAGFPDARILAAGT
jgi:rare lipoprotein A